MTMHVRDGGSWREVEALSAKKGGSWRTIQEGFVRKGGAWETFFVNEITRSITVTCGQQSNIIGYANYGAINTGSRSPTTVDSNTIIGLSWDDGGALDDFVFALQGDQRSWDFISVTPDSESALLKGDADTPGGLYTGGNNVTTWTWSGLTRDAGTWATGLTPNVDIIYD